jgi:hypothetical protein
MDNLVRLRQAPRRIARVQRRIWLLQAAFWAAVALSIVTAIAIARLTWRRRHDAAVVNDVTVAPPDRATGQAVAAPE